MKFLDELTVAAAITKAKLKAKAGKTATIEFCLPIAESPLEEMFSPDNVAKMEKELNAKIRKGDSVTVSLRAGKSSGISKSVCATGAEILAAVPKEILRAYNAMKPKGVTRVEFDALIESQNLEARMAPDAPASLRLKGVNLFDLRLEAMDPQAKHISLNFSVTVEFTKDVGEFLVTNLGAFAFLTISECQQEFRASA